MTKYIRSELYEIFSLKVIRDKSQGITVEYNSLAWSGSNKVFGLFDITGDGLWHYYGSGDHFMDLSQNKSLRVIGIDTI
jgi:hypothetical protein